MFITMVPGEGTIKIRPLLGVLHKHRTANMRMASFGAARTPAKTVLAPRRLQSKLTQQRLGDSVTYKPCPQSPGLL